MGTGFRVTARAATKAVDVYIYEDVGASFFGGISAKKFADDLKAVGTPDEIHLHISSMGGDVFDGLPIYRLLVDHPARVVSYVDGIAASIASVIAMAGEEIHITESGFIMIHDASGLAIGDASDMRQMADTLETVSDSIADVYVARTGKPKKDIRKWMTDETWFTADEAIANGFAQKIIPNLKVAAHYDPAKHKFRKTPAALSARPNYDEAMQSLSRMRAKLAGRKLTEFRAA